MTGGLLVSIAEGRLVESMLYGISSRATVTYVIAVTVMTGSTLVACLVPARRAAAVDPAVTLRTEA